jgi:hypothetical protein
MKIPQKTEQNGTKEIKGSGRTSAQCDPGQCCEGGMCITFLL